jgi:3-methyladenine DNA glycosylase AlkD
VSSRTRDVKEILAWLERRGSKRNREGMARYGITARKVFGVSMGTMQALAKRYGRDHELAVLLWETGWHEARILTAMIADPALLTSRQMDGWVREFDNWAVCDTVCFRLFDRSPYAWDKVRRWSKRKEEFVKRAAFALLASLAAHDKRTGDAPFRRSLRLVEQAAKDERHLVKKGVSWALRVVGHRDPQLHAAAVDLARHLAASPERSARWVGRDALKDLTRVAVLQRLVKQR